MPPEGHFCGVLFGFRNGRLSYALIHRTVVEVANRRKLLLRYDLAQGSA
jgi:hypothetical protein